MGRLRIIVALSAMVVILMVGVNAGMVWADTAHVVLAASAPTNLNDVISNIRKWLIGILAGLATLFLMIGGVRYLLAGGDPGEVEKAKSALRYAAVGYCVALLAPLMVSILQGFVGG